MVITFGSFELHRVTGASWSIGKILLSATYNLFTVSMISTINQVPKYDPMASATPPDKNYNEHKTLEHIYPAITRPPTSTIHTVSPVYPYFYAFVFSTQNMQSEKSVAEEIESLVSEPTQTCLIFLCFPRQISVFSQLKLLPKVVLKQHHLLRPTT